MYELINIEHSDEDAPRNLKQVQNKKYNERKKEKEAKGRKGSGSGLADNFQNIINTVHSDPFVQNVITTKHHIPMIVLFEEKQIMDVKRFCCPGTMGQATILGIDKTYNLGPLHVTPTVFESGKIRYSRSSSVHGTCLESR